jgi:hypothetical protein
MTRCFRALENLESSKEAEVDKHSAAKDVTVELNDYSDPRLVVMVVGDPVARRTRSTEGRLRTT